MAKRREPVKPVEPESESESGEESTEGSEPEPTVSAGSSKKPQPSNSNSDSDSDGEEGEGEEGSESDTSSETKEAITPTKSTTTTTTAKPVKRPAPADSPLKDSKKAKTKQTEVVENSEKKPTPFQRLWSEEDEIVLLKGMIDYVKKKKADPLADLNAFLEFIKKNIHIDVTRTQLQDKIRRLRKKFGNNKTKENKGIFPKSQHEQEAYELSKKIWDDAEGKSKAAANGGTLSLKTNMNKKKAVREEEQEEEGKVVSTAGLKLLAGVGSEVEENLLNRICMAACDGEQGAMWKKLLFDEFKVYRDLLDVKTKKVDLVLEYLNS